jgi:hypothetical protein
LPSKLIYSELIRNSPLLYAFIEINITVTISEAVRLQTGGRNNTLYRRPDITDAMLLEWKAGSCGAQSGESMSHQESL